MILPLILFFIDIFFAVLFEEPMFHFVAAFYFFLLLKTKKNFALVFSLLLILLESFLYHGRFGPPLLILLPMTWLCLKLKKALIVNRLGFSLIVGGYLALYNLVLEPYFLGISSLTPYTIAQIGATLVVVNIFY